MPASAAMRIETLMRIAQRIRLSFHAQEITVLAGVDPEHRSGRYAAGQRHGGLDGNSAEDVMQRSKRGYSPVFRKCAEMSVPHGLMLIMQDSEAGNSVSPS